MNLQRSSSRHDPIAYGNLAAPAPLPAPFPIIILLYVLFIDCVFTTAICAARFFIGPWLAPFTMRLPGMTRMVLAAAHHLTQGWGWALFALVVITPPFAVVLVASIDRRLFAGSG